MKRFIIICLLLLGACDKHTTSSTEQASPANTPPAQAIATMHAAVLPSDAPATAEPNAPAAIPTETPSPQAAIAKPLSVNGWIAGASFSDIKNRIPDNAAITINHEYYEFRFDDTFLMFSKSGQLILVLVNGPEGNLSNGLHMGDAESEVIQLLGQPNNENAEAYHAYVYPFSDYRVEIDTANKQVAAMRLSYLGNETANEDAAMRLYVQQKTEIAAATQADATAPASPETAPAQQNQPRRITFDEYVKISDELLSALVQYTQIMSKNVADDEKLKELDGIDAKYHIYDRALMMENAAPADDKDRNLHIRCATFVTKVDSLLGTGMFYLNLKMTETDENLIADWKKRAAQELQDVWAWVGQKR